MERPRHLNCCYAIIISQVSPRTSRSMSLRATYVPAASHRVTSSMVNSHRYQFPLAHGKAYPATLSPTYPCLRVTILFSLSLTDSPRCAISPLATKQLPCPSSLRCFCTMSFVSTEFPTLLSLTVVRYLPRNFGTP